MNAGSSLQRQNPEINTTIKVNIAMLKSMTKTWHWYQLDKTTNNTKYATPNQLECTNQVYFELNKGSHAFLGRTEKVNSSSVFKHTPLGMHVLVYQVFLVI